MTQNELEVYLLEAMKKLDTATDKILKTNGYTQDAKKMRLMIELIKEQIRNENSMSSARTAR
jgi:TATA-binding protein-associated factor Taf7